MKKIIPIMFILLIILGCAKPLEVFPRESKIPADAIKYTPETDNHPPILHSEDYEKPVPVDYPISTSGAEDSAFITPDGNTLYFFFTPDVKVPVEKQLIDGVTGIYVSKRQDSGWTTPERVILNDDLSLDGCEFVQGNEMWFCSVRQGNMREIDIYIATLKDGKWKVKNAGKNVNLDIQAGELHITSDGKEMYFHNNQLPGKGKEDLWVSRFQDGKWQQPLNIEELNTAETDGWPFVTEDKKELWFTRTYLGTPAIFRSIRLEDRWSEPQLVISQFAGEPSLDNNGNIYFTHHYYKDGQMLEADIYVAKKKQ